MSRHRGMVSRRSLHSGHIQPPKGGVPTQPTPRGSPEDLRGVSLARDRSRESLMEVPRLLEFRDGAGRGQPGASGQGRGGQRSDFPEEKRPGTVVVAVGQAWPGTGGRSAAGLGCARCTTVGRRPSSGWEGPDRLRVVLRPLLPQGSSRPSPLWRGEAEGQGS